MTPLAYFLASVHAISSMQAPPGTELNIRLLDPVMSYSSRSGAPVRAVLIAPVAVRDRIALPAGSVLLGSVRSVRRVGYGIRNERASVQLDFKSVSLPGGMVIPIESRVVQVENAREKVTPAGVIQGVRSTSSISYRVSGYIKTVMMWSYHGEAVEWLLKSLIVQVPEPEIHFPVGTEMTIQLRASATLPRGELVVESRDPGLEVLAQELPSRTVDPESKRPSDLTNLVLLGSRAGIEAAFHAAGWSLAEPISLRTRIRCIRATSETSGFSGTPMTPLLLQGALADMSWHKELNDVSKRHHVRIWKQPVEFEGQQVWVAAATRDVDLAFLRPGHPFTHKISADIDAERDKVARDLVFTGCAEQVTIADRPAVPRLARNATGDSIVTGGAVVALRVQRCSAQPLRLDFANSAPNAVRGNGWQRLVRREVLVTRSDILRSNVYWRAGEGVKMIVSHFVAKHKDRVEEQALLLAHGGNGGPGKMASTLR